jgi:hypothetical protein
VSTQSWGMRAAVALAAVCFGLTGCSQPGGTSAAGTDPLPTPSAATPTKSVDPVCDGIETLFAHMQAQAAGWSPQQNPFDPIMASRTRKLAQDLVAPQRSAQSTAVFSETKATVEALYALANAIAAKKDPAAVTKAVTQTRLAYADLRTSCDLGGEEAPSPPPTDASPTTPPSKAVLPKTPAEPPHRATKVVHQGPTCEAVQKAVNKMRSTWAAWSMAERPFSPHIARNIRTHGESFTALSSRNTSPAIRAAITASANRFADLAAAMGTREQRQVNTALVRSQTAYAQLQRLCSLS